jgi:hypothetical protein
VETTSEKDWDEPLDYGGSSMKWEDLGSKSLFGGCVTKMVLARHYIDLSPEKLKQMF